MKENKDEELQSRREFFKRAAKGALPILGAIVMANMPMVAEARVTPTGCTGSCYTGCKNGCTSCETICQGGCRNACKGCSGGCKNVSR